MKYKLFKIPVETFKSVQIKTSQINRCEVHTFFGVKNQVFSLWKFRRWLTAWLPLARTNILFISLFYLQYRPLGLVPATWLKTTKAGGGGEGCLSQFVTRESRRRSRRRCWSGAEPSKRAGKPSQEQRDFDTKTEQECLGVWERGREGKRENGKDRKRWNKSRHTKQEKKKLEEELVKNVDE